ncbi:hypothetical protein DH2020_042345 [Rehmannia glutinosa]|uniref:Subtilisin-like protease SBT5.3 n=1 Tax=Rehmannia glutinosa TaxID=99300 RepID=A0ABR0UMT6_REHGL
MKKESYIVYLGEHSHGPDVTESDLQRVTDSHTQLLTSFLGSPQKAKESIIYSYNTNINGFAAVLEEEEATEIAKRPDVVSVLLNQGRQLHTTHSWDFLMLETDGVVHPSSLWEKARYGEDTIIATLDTGVWPESKSFSENGMGPIPSKWKGICQFEGNNTHLCNKKLIGARYFNKGYAAYAGPLKASFETTRDTAGHGTHTLSTAAGNFVPGANVFGVGNGTAKGGSPKARAATYKVCWPPINGSECFDADIMKAFDVAIGDGVDVLSVSLGGNAVDYLKDGIAIASFHAVKKGVVVVASAGNLGPLEKSVTNAAPWIITVGASSIDRQIEANVELKNGSVLKGTSLSKPLPEKKDYPLISAVYARAANASADDAILCKPNTLDPEKVRGKIVVCLMGENNRMEKGIEAARAGATGMILCNDFISQDEVFADPHFLPATHLTYKNGDAVFAYVNKTKNPQGYITPPQAVLNTKPAPLVADFSARGPNGITPLILKPDITAPGVNIIAAYSEGASATSSDFDNRTTPFNLLSGTSMSCPHVSGVVGLLKTLYPKWSPAAIRSAIMTTGQIWPNRAMDPGLVYDLTVNDYLDFLCGIGYNQTALRQFSGSSYYDCPKNYSVLNFNNPSITVPNLSAGRSVTVMRKLKNVGQPATYTSSVKLSGFEVTVEPNTLKFDKIGEEKVFKLIIKANKTETGYRFGEVVWSDNSHHVRSPIVVLSSEE